MKKLLLLWTIGFGPWALADTPIHFGDFSRASSLQLNGSATPATTADGHVLQLTPASGGLGSAFFMVPLSLANNASFSNFFSFRLYQGEGDKDATAGQRRRDHLRDYNEPKRPGGLGEGRYSGISPSVAVEFDTWFIPGRSPGSPDDGNHVGIDINGIMGSLNSVSFYDHLNNGDVTMRLIDYDGATKH
jgi:hypothetical protein